MKNLRFNLALLIGLLLSYGSFAQSVNIYGTVTDADSNPVANQEIYISVNNDSLIDSLGNRYFVFETNENGYYSGDFDFDGNQGVAAVETFSYTCYENYVQEIEIWPGASQEVNFEICNSDSLNQCDLSFFYITDQMSQASVAFVPVLNINDSISVSWDFGDGATSSELEPVHQYGDFGEYSVTLTATNEICGTMSVTEPVYVFEDSSFLNGCYADFYFDFDYENEDYNTVIFYDYSYSDGGIVSWTWDFGDGNISNEQNPIHYYDDGEYLVSLTVEGEDGCESTAEYYIWVGESQWYPEECQALFFADYDYEDYLKAAFVDLSWGGNNADIQAWQWNFGDNSGSAEQNPTHRYEEAGEYLVTLTIYTDSCSSSFEEYVYMEDWSDNGCEQACQAFFYPEFDSTATAVQFYDLSIPNPTAWSWDFGDGTSSNEQNPYHVYPSTGRYYVTLIAESDSCVSAFEMEIDLYEANENQKSVNSGSYAGRIVESHAVRYGSSAIEDVKNTQSPISLYPNPVDNVLNVNFNDNTNATVRIVTVTGQLVKQVEFTNTIIGRINTQNLASGVYFAEITLNGNSYSQKFVK